MRACTLFLIAWFAIAGPANAQDVLYRTHTVNTQQLTWKDGEYGPVITFQRALRAAIEPIDAAQAARLTPDGEMGSRTREAITFLLRQPQYRDLNLGEEPYISRELWQRLLPNTPPPSAHERASTLVLTYEDTFFGRRSEWNYCQSSPSAQRRQAPCLSNDPTSFLTWGPRGATAGGGREVQAILLETDRLHPNIISTAFGAEAADVRRLLRLTPGLETERYLCARWLNPETATAWANGFAALGRAAEVRAIYADIYASPDFDGAKMDGFYRLYRELGRTPTEVDYAFFLDRATHSSGVFVPRQRAISPNTTQAITTIAARLREQIPNIGTAPAWQIRRALSQIMQTSNQTNDRNGRDVVFFVDAVTMEELTESERANWLRRGARYASGVGLLDTRTAPELQPTRNFPTRGENASLTAAELQACPLWVLNWRNPGTGRDRTPQITN